MSVGPNPTRAIPLSPESPPSEGIKEGNLLKFSQKRPYTPQSPALSMNFPNQNHAPRNTSPQTASSQATSDPQSFSSSPSQPLGQSQMIPRSLSSIENFTPSSSLSVAMPNTTSQSDELTLQPCGSKRAADVAMGSDSIDVRESPNKKPRLSGILENDRLSPSSSQDPVPPTQSAPDEISLEQVQQSMGSAFLLCRKPNQPVRPHPTQSLLSVYSLQGLVASVAREDPVTKEKINKLRKSYDGQLKELGLSGRNKNFPLPEGQEGLQAMCNFPDQHWEDLKVRGKVVGNISRLGDKLQEAAALAPGPCRNQEFWDNKIGHEPPKARTTNNVAEQKKPSAIAAPSRVNGVAPAASRVVVDDRPKRTGRKRSYKDNSFDGYAEAYGDDDDDGVVLKSGSEDGSRGLGRKRRKKETYTTASPMEGRFEAIGVSR